MAFFGGETNSTRFTKPAEMYGEKANKNLY